MRGPPSLTDRVVQGVLLLVMLGGLAAVLILIYSMVTAGDGGARREACEEYCLEAEAELLQFSSRECVCIPYDDRD